MPIDWQPLVEIVQQHASFVLTSHVRPDCDAIGSELGLCYALRSLGKQVRVINADPVPPHIGFIDPHGDAEVLGHDVESEHVSPEVLVVVDTSSWAQLGAMADVVRATTAQRVIIDHHVSTDGIDALEFKDTAAEATGRLILEAIEALGARLAPEMALPLFTAIATDTGWFRFASVTDKTFDAAGALARGGVKPVNVFRALYEQNSLARLKLQGRILTRVETQLDGRVIYSSATPRDIVETGAEPTDTEDIVNRLLSVAGVEVGLLFLELSPSETKVSLRSRTQFDVRQVAERLGGGGHTAAAGVRVQGPLDEAIPVVLAAVRQALA